MGSYGIGVSRLVGARDRGQPRRRRHHLARQRRAVPRRDPQPEASATRPATRCASSSTRSSAATRCTTTATSAPGVKFADADLMGHPWQIVVGPRGAAAGKVELKRRATGERAEVSPETRSRGSADPSLHVQRVRTRGRRPLSARPPRRALRLRHRRLLAGRHRARRGHADHRHERDGRLQGRPADAHPRLQRPSRRLWRRARRSTELRRRSPPASARCRGVQSRHPGGRWARCC